LTENKVKITILVTSSLCNEKSNQNPIKITTLVTYSQRSSIKIILIIILQFWQPHHARHSSYFPNLFQPPAPQKNYRWQRDAIVALQLVAEQVLVMNFEMT